MDPKKFGLPDATDKTDDLNSESSEDALIEEEGEPVIKLPNPLDKKIGNLRQELRKRLRIYGSQTQSALRLKHHRKKTTLKIHHLRRKGK